MASIGYKEFDDLISNPIPVLHSLASDHTDIQSLLCAFQSIIRPQIDSIPLLGDVQMSESENKLVRFRGMVQNISDPVYYLSTLSIVSENGNESRSLPTIFPDSFVLSEGWKRQEKFPNPTDEYHTIHSISPPNETEWCKSEWMSRFRSKQNEFLKSGNSINMLMYTGVDKIKLNQVLLFYGIITTAEDTPTLHCLLHDVLYYNNPLLPIQSSNIDNNFIPHMSILEVRHKLLERLRFCVSGDGLAAEYLLFNLLSRISARRDITLLGKFSLNISQSSSVISNHLSFLYPQLLTRFLYIPISIRSLQEKQFVPSKDYSTEKLTTGYLQLVDDTLILLDETKLENGKLDSSGLTALGALSELIKTQCIQYDFSFHTLPFNVDAPVLVVTDGKKSIFPVDIIIPLVPSGDISSRPELSKVDLGQIRLFLSALRYFPYDLDGELQTIIQKDWVEMRKKDTGLGPDDLSMLLTVARYLTLSKGETKLSNKIWSEARDLENKRNLRLKSLK